MHFTLSLNEKTVVVDLRENTRSRRMTLRIPGPGRDPIVTVPKNTGHKKVLKFLESNKEWLSTQLDKRIEKKQLSPGVTLPLRGIPHILAHSENTRGTVTCTNDEETPTLHIHGKREFFERRLLDWLKKQARLDIATSVEFYCHKAGLKAKGITIRDQTTRWGSCSSTGRINFSWRLIMAPEFVLDYVVAHEVSHLREMNHSQEFWQLCRSLYTDIEQAKTWMKLHGASLHQYF